MKTFFIFLLVSLMAVSSRAVDGTVFPTNVTIKGLVGTGDHVAADANGRLLRTNIVAGGSGSLVTNADQFAASPTLNIKPGALLTNINIKAASGASLALTVNTNTLVVTNGNVGIGTATPGAVAPNGFTAGGTIAEISSVSGDAAINLRSSNSGLGYDIWSDSATGNSFLDNRWASGETWVFFRGFASATAKTNMVIGTSSGNVGIGTATPTNALDVQGNASIRTNLFLPNLPTNASPVAFLTVDAGGKVFETATPAGGSGTPGGSDGAIQVGTNGTFGGYDTFRFVSVSNATFGGPYAYIADGGGGAGRGSNYFSASGVGALGAGRFVIGTSNGTPRWDFTIDGSFVPTATAAGSSNRFDVGSSNLPIRTLYAQNIDTKEGVSAISGNVATLILTNGIMGVTNGSDAGAGFVGEYISSAVTNIAHYGSGVSTNVTSIALTPGDWEVTGMLTFDRNGAAFSSVGLYMAVSPTTNNSFAGEQSGYNAAYNYGAASNSFGFLNLSVSAVRVNIATNATYYLKGYADVYSAAFPKMSGRISARRAR